MSKSAHCLLLSALVCVSAHAAELRPDQKAAVARLLADVDPSIHAMMRPELENAIKDLTPGQVAMFMQSAGVASADDDSSESVEEDAAGSNATPTDLAHNRAQYEPALRKHWEAKNTFDTFVDSELKAKCPDHRNYAVFREVERYEIMPLRPNWTRAGKSAEAEVQFLGESYVPKEARYKFDFSKVRMTFDKQAVSNAVAKACADWTKEAVAFKEKANQLMRADQPQAASDLQDAARKRVSAIAQTLETALNAQGPAGESNTAMMQALMNPKPVK